MKKLTTNKTTTKSIYPKGLILGAIVIVFSLPGKFSLGIILMGCGYLALVLGIYYANKNGLVSMSWIIFSCFLQSFGTYGLITVGLGFAVVLLIPLLKRISAL